MPLLPLQERRRLGLSIRHADYATSNGAASDGVRAVFIFSGKEGVFSENGGNNFDYFNVGNSSSQHLRIRCFNGKFFILSAGSGQISFSDNLKTWTTQTIGLLAWQDIAYDGTKYVLVGSAGAIRTSTNLETWDTQTSGTGNTLRGITWASNPAGSGPLFVAVGDAGTVITSPDAITWTTQTSGTSVQLNDICYGAGKFVIAANATSNFGELNYSANGVNWTKISSINGAQTNGNFLKINFIPQTSKFVLVHNGTAGGPTIHTSDDGVTWAGHRTSNGGNGYIRAVAYSDGYYLISYNSSNPGIERTTDFTTFTTMVSNGAGNGDINSFATDGAGHWIFNTTFSGQWMRSTDRTTWICSPSSGTGTGIPYYFNGSFYMSITGSVTRKSTNFGQTFTSITSNGIASIPRGIATNTQIERSGGTVVIAVAAGTSGNNIWRSTNGETFTLPSVNPASGTQLNDITYSPELDMFCAVGNSGLILTSTDAGVTWQSRTSNTALNLTCVVWGGDKFICGARANTARYSTDGVTWNDLVIVNKGDNLTLALDDVGYGNGTYIALVGPYANNPYYISGDGLTWTEIFYSQTNWTMIGVYFDGAKFLFSQTVPLISP